VVVGIISDVHANVVALEAALGALRGAGATTVLCLGDLVGYGPAPNETIDLLRSSSVMCTLGEADERIAYRFARAQQPRRRGGPDHRVGAHGARAAARRVAAQQLPVQRRLDTPVGRIRAFHGTAEDPADRLNLQQDPMSLAKLLTRHRCALLACGGTHVPYFRRVPNAGWVVNPGSVGLSLNGEPGADYALVTIDDEGLSTCGWTRSSTTTRRSPSTSSPGACRR
jgi:predicted phosphodiesterase